MTDPQFYEIVKEMGKKGFTSARKEAAGFTLIELLVAMTILALAASIGFVTFSNAQKSGRDERRKQDLHTISISLGFYYAQNKHYPIPNTLGNLTNPPQAAGSSSIDSYTPWIQGLDSNYINNLPKDPINLYTTPYVYQYLPLGTDCNNPTGFVLLGVLENQPQSNSKDFQGQTWKSCNNVVTFTPQSFGYYAVSP